MNSTCYPGLSVTPTDVWIAYDLGDARQMCVIETRSTNAHGQVSILASRFTLEGVAVRLVVPGAPEKEVLRATSKRALSWMDMAMGMLVHGKSLP